MDVLETSIQELIQSGTNINTVYITGMTPLHSACQYNLINIISALINANADLNIRNDDGRTPLNYAAFYGRTNIVHLLLVAGANINSQDNNGNTALMHACMYNNIILLEELIKYGADISLRNNDGKSGLDIAERYESINFIKSIRLNKMIINKEKVKAFCDGWEKRTNQSGIHGPPRQILQDIGLIPKGAYFYGNYNSKLQKHQQILK